MRTFSFLVSLPVSEYAPLSFYFDQQSFELKRYPFDKRSQLKAWDAADEYLLREFEVLAPSVSRVIIVHDNFGCLTLALAPYVNACYGDSWMSFEAVRRNALTNDVDTLPPLVETMPELKAYAEGADCVIGRVPRSKAQLQALLSNLSQWVKPGCQLFLGGMDKHLSRGQFELLEQNFGRSEFLPGVKKARIWRAYADKDGVAKSDLGSGSAILPVPGRSLKLYSAPNVFSRDKLDIGTRFMLDNYAKLPSCEQVADLACGNGVLGLAYLANHPRACLSFFDESFQAIASVRQNLAANFSEASAVAEPGDGLKAVRSSRFDLVLCNPPFHQQSTVSKDIALSLFKDAHRCLFTEGEFWVVANRHLGYHVVLKRLFGNCDTVSGNSKFVLLRCRKNN